LTVYSRGPGNNAYCLGHVKPLYGYMIIVMMKDPERRHFLYLTFIALHQCHRYRAALQ